MFKGAAEKLRRFDWLLFSSCLVLFGLGLAAIYSVSLSQALPDFANFQKQFFLGIVGIGLMFGLSLLNYSSLRVYSRWIYAFSLLALILVLFLGTDIRGTRGWLLIFGMGIQPVELAKISLIILLAKFFSNRLQQFKVGKHIIVSLFLTLTFVVLTMLQPDLGSSLILLGTWFFLLVLSGLPKRYLFGLIVVALVFMVLTWSFFLQDYQKERILVFVNPQSDPLDSGYNVSQSIIAVGSGRWLGRGLGFGSQSQLKFIPESQTDFIFAVIAEELGFFGVALVLSAWLIIFYRLMSIARKAKDDFGLFLVLGVIIILFLHLLINIGMNMGIMPVTGISLPFLSYGGSFLLVSFVLVGISQSVLIKH